MSVFAACVVDHSQIMSVDFCALAFYVALYFSVRILAAASCQCVTLLMMLRYTSETRFIMDTTHE